jgi:hypothetical protein
MNLLLRIGLVIACLVLIASALLGVLVDLLSVASMAPSPSPTRGPEALTNGR